MFNGTTCANNQLIDTRMGIGACIEDVLNDNIRISIHKVNMWNAGNSAWPPGDLWLHRLIVN